MLQNSYSSGILLAETFALVVTLALCAGVKKKKIPSQAEKAAFESEGKILAKMLSAHG